MANTSTAKVANVFSKLWNPLRTLTKPEIERMMSDSNHGDDVRMQLVFQQIELQSAMYQICIQKRTAGVLNREWDIVAIDENDSEALKQQKAVKEMLLKSDSRNIDGLTQAIKHLAMASFRGRSAVKPFFTDDGDLFFKRLNNWNFLEFNGKLYWNPSSEQVGWLDQGSIPPTIQPLPEEEICWLKNDMPIDIPGLMLYLRQLVGEDQWARFIEKQGIPQVVLTTPDGTPDTALPMWNMRAQQIFEGGSGTLPHDAQVNVLDSARGQDPFTEYIKHQQELISILALGGTLLTIAGSTGLGSDLASVQQKQFESLINQDCKQIANAMSNSVVGKCVKKLFGDNAEVKVRFSYVEDSEYGPYDYLNFAEKANAIGMKIDLKQFKKLSGLSFIVEDDVWEPPKKEPSPEWTPEEKEQLKQTEEFKLNS